MRRSHSFTQLDDVDLPAGWLRARVVGRRQWRPGLVTLTLDVPSASARAPVFAPGQAFDLALPDRAGGLLARPYCPCSPPGAPLQFLIVMVPGGALSPRLVSLEPGSWLALHHRPRGDFRLDAVPDARQLWLVATGAGVAPFLSMLHTADPWRRFPLVVLVHAVREVSDLVCRDEVAAVQPALRWIPVVSRQPGLAALPATDDDGERTLLHGRVTALLRSGALESAAAARLSVDASQVMLSGNPGMVSEMTALLAERGLVRAGPDQPGQVRGLGFW